MNNIQVWNVQYQTSDKKNCQLTQLPVSGTYLLGGFRIRWGRSPAGALKAHLSAVDFMGDLSNTDGPGRGNSKGFEGEFGRESPLLSSMVSVGLVIGKLASEVPSVVWPGELWIRSKKMIMLLPRHTSISGWFNFIRHGCRHLKWSYCQVHFMRGLHERVLM